MNAKWVKIPSVAVLQVAKCMRRVKHEHEPLTYRTYCGKKLFGADFLEPKSGHW